MRVLVVAPHPFTADRGTPIAVRLLSASLSRRGHTVTILTYHEGEDIDISNVEVVRIAAPR
ncbi:MAG TPA: hypothetical protein VMT52_00375 [Planctomycetota bacterium]|nr:hypothetical protein [Planctomycetota bacterium]